MLGNRTWIAVGLSSAVVAGAAGALIVDGVREGMSAADTALVLTNVLVAGGTLALASVAARTLSVAREDVQAAREATAVETLRADRAEQQAQDDRRMRSVQDLARTQLSMVLQASEAWETWRAVAGNRSADGVDAARASSQLLVSLQGLPDDRLTRLRAMQNRSPIGLPRNDVVAVREEVKDYARELIGLATATIL